ncbi:hypothetical protein THAOC_03549, partial [Thalassiosira oceanica]
MPRTTTHQHRGARSPRPSEHERTAADDPDNPTAPPAPNIPVITPALRRGPPAPTSTPTGLIQYGPFGVVMQSPRKLDRALEAVAEPNLTNSSLGDELDAAVPQLRADDDLLARRIRALELHAEAPSSLQEDPRHGRTTADLAVPTGARLSVRSLTTRWELQSPSLRSHHSAPLPSSARPAIPREITTNVVGQHRGGDARSVNSGIASRTSTSRSILSDNDRQLLVQLKQQLTDLAEEKIEEAHAAQTSLKTTTEGAVNVNEALTATLAAARTSLQNNLEVLDASTARLEGAITLRDSAERATGKLEAVNDAYVERFGELSNLMNVAETTSKKLRETTKTCEEKTAKAKRKSDSIHTLLQRLDTSTNKSTQALDDIDERHALLDRKHTELESLRDSVSTKLATVSSLLDSHEAKLTKATDLHKTAVAGADVLAKEMYDVRETVSTTKKNATTEIKKEKSSTLQSFKNARLTIDKTLQSTLEHIQSAGNDCTGIDAKLESLVSQRLDATLVDNDVQAKLDSLVSAKLKPLGRIRPPEGDCANPEDKMESLMQAKFDVLVQESGARLDALLEEKLNARVPQSPTAQPTPASGDDQWNGGFGDMSTIRSTSEESAPSSQRATTPHRQRTSRRQQAGPPAPASDTAPG